MSRKAYLALEDGTVFEGTAFAADGMQTGEVVFNTSMTGYQEILTDPSYARQIVTMTYPLIGNYGVNTSDVEAPHPWASGMVVKEYSEYPSNWRKTEPLGEWLARYGIIGISGVDTRMLTKKLRVDGSMKACLATGDQDANDLVRRARESQGMKGMDCVPIVSRKEPMVWTRGIHDLTTGNDLPTPDPRHHVVAFDFGCKENILRLLSQYGAKVTVLPGNSTAEEALALNPDGVFLANGPGDPEAVTYAIDEIKKLLVQSDSTGLPIFGICLGVQLMSWALGAQTYKLKFGHRGGNQPVMNLETGKVEITSQNHGFAIDSDSVKGDVEVSHINLNDNTVEGVKHTRLPVFGVQYHPEASPGPHDAQYLFQRFSDNMDQYQAS
jgi:carbamoyl-phosphate synthase small subunit